MALRPAYTLPRHPRRPRRPHLERPRRPACARRRHDRPAGRDRLGRPLARRHLRLPRRRPRRLRLPRDDRARRLAAAHGRPQRPLDRLLARDRAHVRDHQGRGDRPHPHPRPARPRRRHRGGARPPQRQPSDRRQRRQERLYGDHDPRAAHPLNIVIGYGELLADEVAERGHHDLKEQADRVTGAARHLLSLISDILDLSRIEAERIELHLERIPLRPLVDELIESFEPLAQERGDRLIAVVDDALPPIRSDRLRLRQILVNLLTNAIKFTESGQITVRVDALPRDDRPWVRFIVEDTGIGIPQEKLVEIFAPFTQADASTTRIYGGAGLGLAICERLALALGGVVTVTSQVGVGSAFTLEIPANPDDDATTTP
ncbi:MAG: hypothetical protein IPK80_01495 [Nannocystis sp.]|nr:hypothetical protein [Nannocystis sp.]